MVVSYAGRVNDDAFVRTECEALVFRYCVLVDSGDAAEVVDLFTDDAVWSAPGTELRGRDQLQRGFEARQGQTQRVSRHVCTTFDLSRTESDRAEGTVYLTLYRYDLGDGEQRPAPLVGPALVGAYHDVFERGPDGWRIAQRRLVVDFLAEES